MYDDSEDDEIIIDDYSSDLFDEANYQKEREEDREYAIRSESLTHAMVKNGFSAQTGKSTNHTADMVIADAEKFANFLRGKAA